MGGMVTGMDTEATIKALMASSRARLARQQQQRTLTNWRIQAYRNVRNDLQNFRNRSVIGANPNHLAHSSFFNTFNTSVRNTVTNTTSDAITVRTTAGSNPGTFTIDRVTQLATYQTFTTERFEGQLRSTRDVFLGDGGGRIFAGQQISLRMGTSTQTINLDTLTNLTGDDFKDELQRLVNQAFGLRTNLDHDPNDPNSPARVPAIRVDLVDRYPDNPDGLFRIELYGHTSTVTVVGGTSPEAGSGLSGLGGLGFAADQSNRISLNNTSIMNFFALHGNFGELDEDMDVFRFSINGVELFANRDDTLQAVINRINSSSANVSIQFNHTTESFTFTSRVRGEGNNLRMHDIEGNFLNAFIGAPSGNLFTSGPMFTSSPRTGGNLANNLDAFVQSFITNLPADFVLDNDVPTFAGGNFALDPGGDYAAFFTRFNTALANQSFRLEVGGSHTNVTLDLSALRQTITVSNPVLDPGHPDHDPNADPTIDRLETFAEMFSRVGSLQNAVLTRINNLTNSAAAGGVTAGLDSNGDIVFATNRHDAQVRLVRATGVSGHQPALGALFGITGADVPLNTAATANTLLGDIGIADGAVSFSIGDPPRNVTFAIDGTTTIAQFMNSINSDPAIGNPNIMSFQNGRVVLNGFNEAIEMTATGGANSVIQRLFGVAEIRTSGAAGAFTTILDDSDPPGTPGMRMGTNAEVIMNGRVVTSTNNTFLLDGHEDGTQFTVHAKSNDPITITIASDVDALVDRIRVWIAEYNAMVDSLHDLISETPNRAFPPLTDEQRAEMTREEIERWEEQARTGILSRDPTVRGILTELRNNLSHTVEAAGLSLFDLGITTESPFSSPNARNNGRLELTFDGERTLRRMIETNPEAVRLVFQAPAPVVMEMNAEGRLVPVPVNDPPVRVGGRNIVQSGLANRIDNVIQNAIRTQANEHFGGNVGSLVMVAGTEFGLGNQNATLVRRVSDIDRQISVQQARMEREFSRLWARFTALETAIARMSAQSGWLDQFTMRQPQH